MLPGVRDDPRPPLAMIGARPDVLLLAHRPEAGLGARALLALLDRLEARGISGRLLCPGASLGADSPRIHAAPLLKTWFLRPFLLRRLWRETYSQRPCLLHVIDQNLSQIGLELAEIAGIPYLQGVSSFSVLDEGLRISHTLCKRLVVSGERLGFALVDRLGVPTELITVIPPGIEIQGSGPPQPNPNRARVIGTILTSELGIETFLNAARAILDRGFDAEFVIAGSGTQLSALRGLLDDLGLSSRVTFVDHPASARQLPRVLDVFCDPGGLDSPSIELVHALAHGVPTVAAATQTIPAVLEHRRTGLLVPMGAVSQLAEGIAELLNDPNLARRLGENAQELARSQFNPETEADQLAALYRNLLEPENQVPLGPIPVNAKDTHTSHITHS